MNFIGLLLKLIPLLRELIDLLQSSDDCPPGACGDLQARLTNLQEEAESPKAAGFLDFVRCLDIPRFVAAVRELIDVIMDAMRQCPPVDTPVED